MFRKLLSNLSFNPSLINQVSFYATRLHKEAFLRRVGLAFMVLTMGVQLFAAAAPPVSSLNASPNDIVYGGIRGGDPKANMLRVYDADNDGRNGGIKALFKAFNINREDIANTCRVSSVNSSDRSLYSLGRQPGSTLDQRRSIGGSTYYQRPLHVWGNNVSHPALVCSRNAFAGDANDRFFAILLDCGNIVEKVRPKPSLAIAKTGFHPADGATVKRGDTLQYRIFFSNVGAGDASYVTITDAIPAYTTYDWHGTGGANKIDTSRLNSPSAPFLGQPSSRHISWEWSKMPRQTERWYTDLRVKVNADAPNGARICNTAIIRSIDNAPVTSNPICYTVSVPTTPAPRPTPTPVTPTTPTTPTPVVPIPVTTVEQPGQPAISRSKLASNITQGVNNAHNTTASPNDYITYQLLTINSGQAMYDDYVIDEDINDIKQYANIVEISDGGEEKNGKIVWKPVDIKVGETVTRIFKIQVKATLPSTPTPPNDPESFDLRMDNIYGNEVQIKVASPSVGKTVEQVTTTLPKTGPGTSTAVAVALTVIVGYFFARSRLMAKELDMVREEYATAGGY